MRAPRPEIKPPASLQAAFAGATRRSGTRSPHRPPDRLLLRY